MSRADASVTATLAALTHVGLARVHNEDTLHVGDDTGDITRGRAELRERTTLDHGFSFGVYDGMGGMSSGELASREAAGVVAATLAEEPRPRDEEALRERLIEAVQRANRAIYLAGERDPRRRGNGSTATVAAVIDGCLLIAQVGDSRGYLLRDRELVQITADDRLDRHMAKSLGRPLTAEELGNIPRNVITKALGMSLELTPEITRTALRRGDVVLLATDGLTELVADATLRAVLLRQRDPGVACSVLCDEALGAGGHDNLTLVVARFDGEGLRPPIRAEKLRAG